MSNLSKIINHLDASSVYGISVTDRHTEIRLKREQSSRQKYIFTKANILKESPGVEEWLKHLPDKGITSPRIDLMYPNGTSMISKGVVHIDFVKRDGEPIQPSHSESEPMNTAQAPTPYTYSLPISSIPQLPPAYGLGAAVAMPTMDIISLKNKEQKLEDIQERVDEMKETIRELRNSNNRLESENIRLKAQVDNAEFVKELALERKALEQRSFMDSPTMVKIVEGLGSALPLLLAKSAPGGIALGAGMSENKRDFIEAMQDEQITDEMIMMLHYTLKGIVKQPGFTQQLNQLIHNLQ